MRPRLPLWGGVMQRLKHGFDLVQESDDRFKQVFIKWVHEEIPPNQYTITDYDNYLVLKHAEALDFSEDEIRRETNKYSAKHALITKFKELVSFRDEPVHAMREDVSGIRHTKKNKPTEKRTALLGTYVGKGGRDTHVRGTLGAFVEEAPEQEKVEARKEKWLRVPDEDWSALVNAEWVNAMASHGHSVKIVSPMKGEQKEMVRAAFKSRHSGATFLTALRDKFENEKVRHSKNPLWDDTRQDPEADAPSTLAYEIAGLLDAGNYELDQLYEDRKGMLKVRKRQHDRNEARKGNMEAMCHKDYLVIQNFRRFCIDRVEGLVERRSQGDNRVLETVKAMRTEHYPLVRARWIEAAAVARHPNFKIFLRKRKNIGVLLLAWMRALDKLLTNEPAVKKNKPFFRRILADAREKLQGFDTSDWDRFSKS
jgi:hypothetical protein